MKKQHFSLVKTMILIAAAAFILFGLGYLLINEVNPQSGSNQLFFGLCGLFAMAVVVFIGYRKFLDQAYYIAVIGCFLAIMLYRQNSCLRYPSEYLMFTLAGNLWGIHLPTFMSISIGLAAVKFYSELKPDSWGNKYPINIIYVISFLLLQPIIFANSIPKGYILAISGAVFTLILVQKYCRRGFWLLGMGSVIAAISYGLSLRPRRVFYASEQALKMIEAGGWSGTVDATRELLGSIPDAITSFFYAAFVYVFGVKILCVVLLLVGILLALCIYAACRVKTGEGKNLICYMAAMIFIQALVSFTTVFQFTRGAFYCNVPFLGYGFANILGSMIALGFIVSAVWETVKAEKAIDTQ